MQRLLSGSARGSWMIIARVPSRGRLAGPEARHFLLILRHLPMRQVLPPCAFVFVVHCVLRHCGCIACTVGRDRDIASNLTVAPASLGTSVCVSVLPEVALGFPTRWHVHILAMCVCVCVWYCFFLATVALVHSGTWGGRVANDLWAVSGCPLMGLGIPLLFGGIAPSVCGAHSLDECCDRQHP